MARCLKLASEREWRAWCRTGARPSNVPCDPGVAYRAAGWLGWRHWLGNSTRKRVTKAILPFCEALTLARSLELVTQQEWRVWSKSGARPPSLPACPELLYKGSGWRGWGHWLGTGSIRNGAKQPRPFATAPAGAPTLAAGGTHGRASTPSK